MNVYTEKAQSLVARPHFMQWRRAEIGFAVCKNSKKTFVRWLPPPIYDNLILTDPLYPSGSTCNSEKKNPCLCHAEQGSPGFTCPAKLPQIRPVFQHDFCHIVWFFSMALAILSSFSANEEKMCLMNQEKTGKTVCQDKRQSMWRYLAMYVKIPGKVCGDTIFVPKPFSNLYLKLDVTYN